MSETVGSRGGRVFEGMAYPDANPLRVHDEDIRYVDVSDIPQVLCDRAHQALDLLPSCEWWTVGEFRYAGEDYSTAVARRGADGRVTFGVETDG